MAGAKRGRVEAVATLAANKTITFDDSVAAAQPVTVTAGTYTITSLVAFLTANVVGGGHWTITVSGGESGTGKITIDTSDRPFSVTWADSTTRTWMGFSADIAGVSAAQTGTNARGLWLPDAPKWTPHGDDDGTGAAFTRVPALRQTKSPTGDVKTLVGGSYSELRGMRWEGISRGRAKIIGETVTSESFERFYRDTQLGEFAYFTPGPIMRVYWDADVATYTQVRFTGLRDFDPGRMVESWVGRYIVQIPTCVLV